MEIFYWVLNLSVALIFHIPSVAAFPKKYLGGDNPE